MPREKNNMFEYDNLFMTKRKTDVSSNGEDGFVPMGSGRKSRYALSVTQLNKDAPDHSESDSHPQKQANQKNIPKKKKKNAPRGTSPKPSAKKPTASVARASMEKKKRPAGKKPLSKKRYSKKSKKRSFREEFLTYSYVGALAVGGGMKTLFGRRRNRVILCLLLGIIVLFCCYRGAMSLYRSNSILTDSHSGEDTSARTKELTDAANRDKVTYFLIVGVDKDKKLTDCIWMLCFDNKAHRMNVLQIPRDTYVGQYSMSPHKANAIFESKTDANWCEACDRAVTDDKIESGRHTLCGGSISTKKITGMSSLFYFVNNELHLPVDYYVKFDFEGFEKAIDALGGVDITLENEMDVYYTKSKHITLPKGPNHLNGAKTLKFMRNRKTYADGDLGRIKAQRQIIHAILEKVQDMSLLQTFNVVLAANGSFTTDMSPANIKSYISPLKKCKSDDLHMFELPGKARTVNRSSYYICDEEKTVELLNEYMLPYSDRLHAGDIDFPDP